MGVPRGGRIVVVGGGPAAAAAAVALREIGHDGGLVIVGGEPRPPYSRPPLSKAFLSGGVEAGDLALGVADAELRTGVRAIRVDLDERRVHLADGERLPYDGLVLATGTRARRPRDPSVEVVSTIADAERVSARMARARSALVVGSGFLAYELASATHARGIETTLVIRPGALAARWGMLADVLTDRVRTAGIRLVESPGVAFGDGTAITADGRRWEADLVLAAIGAEPDVIAPEYAATGYLTDDRCRLRRTVVAAGDAATVRSPGGARRDRTWTNALAQGAAAARSLLDDDAPPYAPVPYAWTEACGTEVKIAGAPPLGVAPAVIDGDLSEGRALLQWPGGAAAVGYRIPVARLKTLAAAPAPATLEG